jgi:hypothetical protein
VIPVGLIDDVELPNGPALVVAQERERGAQSGTERGGDLRSVGADHSDVAVVDIELALQLDQVPQLALALRSPVATVEGHDQGVPVGELAELHGFLPMIGQLEIGKGTADNQIRWHR